MLNDLNTDFSKNDTYVVRLVELVVPVPKALVIFGGNYMVFRDKGEHPTASNLVPGVAGRHIQMLHAAPNLDILVDHRARQTHLGIRNALDHESSQGLPTEYVSRSSRHITLFHKRLKLKAKMYGCFRIVRIKHITHILDDRIGVVIGLVEEVGIVVMVLIDVLKRLLDLGPQILATLAHIQLHRGQLLIHAGAHEEQDITAFAPSSLHVASLNLVVGGIGHHPAEDANLLLKLLGHGDVVIGMIVMEGAMFLGLDGQL